MAIPYNNYFPMNYQFQGYSQPQQQQQQSNGIIWVHGEDDAKDYFVAPNTTVQLWDSKAQVIYLKSADASGMRSMKIIDYTFRDTSHNGLPQVNQNSYVTKDEFDAFKQEIHKMIGGKDNESTVSANGNGKPNKQYNK